MFNYTTHEEIPSNFVTFVENLTEEPIATLTMDQVNNFLNYLDSWYKEQGQNINDYIGTVA